MNLLRRLSARWGMDRAVVLTLAGRGWTALAGVFTLVCIGWFLTPELQGYYFTFGSLIALQLLVELGLGNAIVQFASHEMAALAWTVDGTVVGDVRARARLRSLLRFAAIWFSAAALLMVAVLLPLGHAFIAFSGAPWPPDGNAAWSWLVVLTAAQLVVSAALALLEGCGRVAEVSLARLAQAVVSSIALWLALAAGAGLHALVFQAAAGLLTLSVWLLRSHGAFFRDLWTLQPDGLPGISWRHEIWPFQWRIAVSWASGLLIAQLFTPLLLASHGPVAAGQMGLSLQVFAAFNGMAAAWISTRVPTYGRMISRGEGQALDGLFRRGLLQSLAALALALGLLLLAVAALDHAGSPLARRMVPLHLVCVLALVALASHVNWAESALLRAHKRDPFMALSVANGAVTAALCFAWIPPFGLNGAVAAHATSTFLVALVGGSFIFLRKRRAWWLAAQPCLPERIS